MQTEEDGTTLTSANKHQFSNVPESVCCFLVEHRYYSDWECEDDPVKEKHMSTIDHAMALFGKNRRVPEYLPGHWWTSPGCRVCETAICATDTDHEKLLSSLSEYRDVLRSKGFTVSRVYDNFLLPRHWHPSILWEPVGPDADDVEGVRVGKRPSVRVSHDAENPFH